MFTRSAELYDAVYGFKDYVAEAGNLHALIQARAPGAATLLDVATASATRGRGRGSGALERRWLRTSRRAESTRSS
ncbi:MAG: hypothetical protein H0V20_00395 [Actinobacteria bacterium]|nr:hypothetical protein [Actinomycetota bacterium]